jgi:hypothetical protein
VRHHTLAYRARIDMDRAMPEHIGRARVGGGVLSLPPGRLVLVYSVWLNVQRSWGIMAAVVLQPASQKRPDSELRKANSVRALSFVSALLSSLASLYSSYGFSPWVTDALKSFDDGASARSPLHLPLRL